MDTFDENFAYFRGMETSETILVSQGQVLEAELYRYRDDINIPKYSVGTIKRIGKGHSTAWVSSVVNTPFWYRYRGEYHKVIATAITAAHTIYFNVKSREVIWYFCVDPKNKNPERTFKAAPFIDFVDEAYSYKDPITRHEFSLPGDMMLFLIFETPGTNVTLSPLVVSTRKLKKGQEVATFGYPGRPSILATLESICPLSIKHTSIDDTDILRAIRGGDTLVKSSGNILRVDDLMCVSCTSVPGMSGSPVCVIENGEYRVVGILLGGPAAPFQRDLADIIDCEIRRDWLNAERILDRVMGSRNVEKYLEVHILDTVGRYIAIKKPIQKILWDLHANLAPNYVKNGNSKKANHNLVLSKTSDPFMVAIQLSRLLSEIESQEYTILDSYGL